MSSNDAEQHPQPFRSLLILLAILTVLLGLILLTTTPVNDTIPVPTAFWVIIFGAILFVAGLMYRSSPFLQTYFSKFSNIGSSIWILFSIFLSVLAAVASYLFEKDTLSNYIPVISIWLLAAVFYLAALIPVGVLQHNWREWFLSHKHELLILGAIFLLATAFRFYKLGDYPRVIDGDEGRIGLFAQGTVTGTLVNPYALWENIGALYLQAINFVISWLGASPFSLRLLPAIAGTLAIPSIYLLARQVSNKNVAIIAAILLAISHTHIHFSRTVAVSYIQGTWLIPLQLYFLLSGLEKRSSWRAGLAGILVAIDMSIYLSAQITIGIIVVYMLIAFLWLRGSFRPAWRQAVAFWEGFVLTFIPEGTYMLLHPDELFNRINENGTVNSGWLANEILLTGKSTVQILMERVGHAFLTLIYYPAIDFYGSPTPVLNLISGSLFILGLGYILVKTRSLKFLLLNGYFWGITVAIGVFAIPPSADSYRMLIALPGVFVITAIGLDQVLNKLGLAWHHRPYRYLTFVSTILASLLIFNVWTYYFDFLGRCRFGGDTQTRFASYLGNYVRSVQSEADIYLLSDDVFRYGTHGSTDFLTQERAIINLPEPINSQTFVAGETIIATPDRIDELRMWARENPGGELHFEYDCEKPILLSYQKP